MPEMSCYIRDLSALGNKAETDGLPVLGQILNMALEHARHIERETVAEGTAKQTSEKRPYTTPKLTILHIRQRNAA
jgi:hypothetical protein